jgi:hypothetical protein
VADGKTLAIINEKCTHTSLPTKIVKINLEIKICSLYIKEFCVYKNVKRCMESVNDGPACTPPNP